MSHKTPGLTGNQLYGAVSEVYQNVKYIQKELPTLEMPEAMRDEILQVCHNLEQAMGDLMKRVAALNEKLNGSLMQATHNIEVAKADAVATKEWTAQKLNELTLEMDVLVKKLWVASDKDQSLQIVSVLMNESAANILLAFLRIKQELNIQQTKMG